MNRNRELNTVDLFCGAGGASTGMELALSRLSLHHKGLAINHWSVAVDTMRLNHPCIDTKQMSIEEAVPADLVPGGEVDLLWASPSCTHHVECTLIVDKYGIGIDAVKQSRIRKAIVEAVGEAVSFEGDSPNKEEEK